MARPTTPRHPSSRPSPAAARAGLVLGVTAALTAFTGCDRANDTPQAATPPRDVVIATAAAEDVPVELEFVGRTASSQRVEVRSRVSGFLDEILYEEGGFIEKGDPMFQVDPEPFNAALRAARAEMAQQEARLENAEVTLARVQDLALADAVAQKEIDDAESTQREAAAAVEAAAAKVYQAELDLGYTLIAAPVSGVTGSSDEREGAYLGIGSAPLTYVAKIDPMWVEFSVSEIQALDSLSGQARGDVVAPPEGEFDVFITLADGTDFPEKGVLSFADAAISETTGTFLVRAEIPNPSDALRPGQFVRIHLRGAYRPDAMVIPKRAVRQGPKGAFVWVAKDDNTAEQRPVETGPWHEDRWVIEQGLQAGDRVVVDGAVGLTPGAAIRVVQPDDS